MNEEEQIEVSEKNTNEVPVTDKTLAEFFAKNNWQDVKYSNARENQVSDSLITSQIQAAAIFIALQSAFLTISGIDQSVKYSLAISVVSLAVSIVFGLFGFYRKEQFWSSQSHKYQIQYSIWIGVWKGEITISQARKLCGNVNEHRLRADSPRWPLLLQGFFFGLALLAAFIGSIVNFLS